VRGAQKISGLYFFFKITAFTLLFHALPFAIVALQLDTVSLAFTPLFKAFAEVLCFEPSSCSP